MTITPRFDAAGVRQWLAILHGDSPGHIHICSTDDWAGRTFTDLDAATNYATYLDTEGREGIYTRITTLRATLAPGRRGGAEDTAALPALWADLDLAGPGHAEHDLPPDVDAGRLVVAESGLPEPTLWVHSGGGLYPIWLLTAPYAITDTNRAAAARLAADWQKVLEHSAARHGWRYGRGVGDLSRVLRIPGTINRKEGLARPCRIIDAAPARYTVDELTAALDAAITRITPPTPPAVVQVALGAVERPPGSVTPGDDYASRTDWSDIIAAAGGREHYRQDDVTYWTRPGKPSGISASTNALGTDRLHIFTTSWAPFDGGESYSKFGAYALLHHSGDHTAAAKALSEAGYGTPLPSPAEMQREAFTEIIGQPMPDPPVRPPVPGRTGWTPEVDATTPALAADWLREEIGRGRLAGYFQRADQIVHTPREGEEGYIATGHAGKDDDGPAQVRPVNDSTLASRISYTYGVFRQTKRGSDYVCNPALFPRSAARLAVDVPDMMPHLRTLRGVVHSPVLRADGTVLSEPGYDDTTGLLYLPEPGLIVPPVPEQPTGEQVADAAALLGRMIDGFAFVSKHDRANFLGLLLTPLLRALAPPPYQLAAITAPQPGSGKTLLASLARIIHGGVFRAELPLEEDELRKQITTILVHTTGPVVHFDNVSGTLRSSTIAALLTSAQWDDRKLGTNEMINARNDRLWMITGNNLSLGGDLTRRTIWITIDPGVPDPHLRTDFAIENLEQWTKDNRGPLLHALLTLARRWIAAGKPMTRARGSDAYSRWIQITSAILATAGIEGEFAAAESARQEIGADDTEWNEFLSAVHEALGANYWTVRELIQNISEHNSIMPTGPIPFDVLPVELAEKAIRPTVGLPGIAKSLGRWLANREGRWAGALTVRRSQTKTRDGVTWRIEKAPQ